MIRFWNLIYPPLLIFFYFPSFSIISVRVLILLKRRPHSINTDAAFDMYRPAGRLYIGLLITAAGGIRPVVTAVAVARSIVYPINYGPFVIHIRGDLIGNRYRNSRSKASRPAAAGTEVTPILPIAATTTISATHI